MLEDCHTLLHYLCIMRKLTLTCTHKQAKNSDSFSTICYCRQWHVMLAQSIEVSSIHTSMVQKWITWLVSQFLPLYCEKYLQATISRYQRNSEVRNLFSSVLIERSSTVSVERCGTAACFHGQGPASWLFREAIVLFRHCYHAKSSHSWSSHLMQTICIPYLIRLTVSSSVWKSNTARFRKEAVSAGRVLPQPRLADGVT